MPDFDELDFENRMANTVKLFNSGRIDDARDQRIVLYDDAPPGSIQKGRAARDVSACSDKKQEYDDAEIWIGRAYAIHAPLVDGVESPKREPLRQLAVTEMYVGVNGIRRATQALRQGDTPDTSPFMTHFNRVRNLLSRSKRQARGINRLIDQYDINAGRRISAGESLDNHRIKGIWKGLGSTLLSFMSESRLIDTRDPKVTVPERYKSKGKAFLGGLGAIAVGVIASKKPGRRRNLAWKIANRIM